MRKFTLILLLFAFVGHVFAQNIQKSQMFMKRPLKKAISIETEANSLKGTKAYGDIIWSEDFTDGVIPAGWSVNDNTGNDFDWIVSNSAPGGQYTNEPKIASTSGGYFMSLRGDFYNTPVPGTGAVDMDAYFQTGAIDCSGQLGVVLRFEHSYRYCCYDNGPLRVLVSNNGTSWTEFNVTNVFGNIDINDSSPNPETVELNISNIAGDQSTVYIRFYEVGASHYYWMVDDIALISPPADDMQLNTAFVSYLDTAIGYYSQVPVFHEEGFFMGVKAYNNGTNDQTNVTLTAEISDGTGVIQTITGVYPDTWTPFLSDYFYIDTIYIPSSTPAEYSVSFSMTSDVTDEFPNDNIGSGQFAISDTTFARDMGSPTTYIGPSMYTGSADGDGFGISYWPSVNDTVGSISVFIDNQTTAGTFIKGELWRGDPTLGDYIVQIEGSEYEIQPGDLGNWVHLKLVSDDGFSDKIEALTEYVAVVRCYFGNDDVMLGDDLSNPDIHDYPMETMLLLGSERYYTTHTPMIRLNMERSFVVCPEPLAVTSFLNNVTCFGDDNGSTNINATGGNDLFTYHWSTGETSPSLSGLAPGTYTVTVATCESTVNEIIEFNIIGADQPLSYSTSYTDPICATDNGEIALTVSGGVSPFEYTWSSGGVDATASNLGAGTHTFTITDANTCSTTGSIELVLPEGPTVGYVATQETATGNDGSVTTNVTGGTSPYTYSWTGPNSYTSTEANPTGLASGWYNLTVTDNNSCTYESAVYVAPYQAGCDGFAVNVTGNDINCYNGTTGSATASATGGTTPYNYSWNDNGTQATVTAYGLAAGSYTVIVTDGAGCQTTGNVSLIQPALITTEYIVTDVRCFATGTGSVNLSVSGGASPFTYSWAGGATSQDVNGLTSGTYAVTVQDDNNCSVVLSNIVVNQPDKLEATVETTPTNSAVNDGTATAVVTGGTSPYSYNWSNSTSEVTATGLSEGNYSVSISDDNGCVTVASGNVILGIEDIEALTGINIYPNPTNGVINIENAENAEITVYNILGELITRRENAEKNCVIDLTFLSQGTYLMKIKIGSDSVTTRISITK